MMDRPRDIVETLSEVMQGHYFKFRVGDWRLICDCDIEDDRIVVRMLRLGNRRERYR